MDEPQPYIDACQRDICSEKLSDAAVNDIVCDYLSDYASKCKQFDVCEEWRQNIPLTCTHSMSCPTNSHFEECGTGCDHTCDPTECDTIITAGCYCNDGMVSS